jgi:hypothetical protein
MCLSCGCGKPNDTHGDSRNITLDDLDMAAQAAGLTREQVSQNITRGVQNDHSDTMNTGSHATPGQNQNRIAGYAQSPDPQQVGQVQVPNAENNYGQVHGKAGTFEPSPGREAGTTAWSNEEQEINYQLPGQQNSQYGPPSQ